MDSVTLFALVASIGNLLHGWDNASMAGAILYLKKEFNLQNNPNMEGFIMAMSLLGATICTILSGPCANKFGRKPILFASAVVSTVSDIFTICLSQNIWMLLFVRFLKGSSIGLTTALVPVYISEIAPSNQRGRLNTLPQLGGSGGMFLSYCIVFWMSLMIKVDWRIMLGIQSIPSVIYSVLIIVYIPESPMWLKILGRVNEMEEVLQKLQVDSTPSLKEYLVTPYDGINILPSQPTSKTKWANLFESGVIHALFVGVGIQILQQFAGINGILYYTPQMLEQAGVQILSNTNLNSSSMSIIISALTTLFMLVFSFVGIWLMDRCGRRQLLLGTIPILLVSLIILIIVNIVNLSTKLNAIFSIISVCIYLGFFSMGFGPIPNMLCAEIFPTRARATCVSICVLICWICQIIVTYSFPVLMQSISCVGVFGIFAIVCLLSLPFVYYCVCETNGITVEDIV